VYAAVGSFEVRKSTDGWKIIFNPSRDPYPIENKEFRMIEISPANPDFFCTLN